MPFIQNDICPSTDNPAPGDFFPEAQKSPDPFSLLQLRRRTEALTGYAGSTCLENLSGLSRLFAQKARNGGDALPQRTAGRSGLSLAPSACRLPTGPGGEGAAPPQQSAERLDCAGRLRSSLCQSIRPEGLETRASPASLQTAEPCRLSPNPLRWTVRPEESGRRRRSELSA